LNKLFLPILFVALFSILFSSEEAFADTVNLVPSSFGYVTVNAPAVDSSCGTSGASKTFNQLLLRAANPDFAGACHMSFVQWDTSIIPDGSTISQVVFNFDVIDVIPESEECDLVDMGDVLTSSSSAGSLAGPLQLNSAYVSSFGPCDNLGSQTVALGSSANSDLEDLLSQDRFFLGIRFIDNHERSGGSAVTELAQTSIDVTFNAPVVGGEIIPIETISLVLAGLQTPAVWMISTFSALGIGTFLLTRNPYNVRNIKVILRDYLDRL